MSEDMISVEDFRAQAEAWAKDNLEPRDPDAPVRPRGAAHHDRENVKPARALQKKIYEAGYAGITVPKEYGGQGLTGAHERAWQQVSSKYVLPDLGVAGGTTLGVCMMTMLDHAEPQVLERWVPRMLSGDVLMCQFFSEPGAGSDLAGITTRAVRDGDNWIINGSKVWSSGAAYSDYGFCLARTNWEVPKHRGLTWFIVPTDAPGVEVHPLREINGDAEFCQEFFTDVMIPDADRVGDVDMGWTVAQTMLVYERGAGRGGGGEAPRPAPVGRFAPDLVALATRVGRTGDPVVRQAIARAHVNSYVQGELAKRVGALIMKGGNAAGIASYGKLASAQFMAERARIGMEIGRGAALVWEEGDLEGQRASLDYLNGRVMAIAGGTSEMQRNGIGERVLGLPREPRPAGAAAS
jgi:alkylation response protein AidB-like acyl-CoA dehydrogenase